MKIYIEIPIYVLCILLSVLTFHFVAPTMNPTEVALGVGGFIAGIRLWNEQY